MVIMIRLLLLRISILRNISGLLRSIGRLLRNVTWLLRSIGRLLRIIGRLLRSIGRLLRIIGRLLRSIGRLLRRIHWLRNRNGLSRLCDKHNLFLLLLVLLSKTIQTFLTAETYSNDNNDFQSDQ